MSHLGEKKDAFVAALLGGSDVATAARAAGRCARTASRWLKEPSVLAALSQAQGERLMLLSANVLSVADKALDVLSDVLDDSKTPAYVRVAAAKAVLDSALRLYEYATLNARIEALESVVAQEPVSVRVEAIEAVEAAVAHHDAKNET